MTRTNRIAAAALAAGLLCPPAASANETITYTYDARGRLIRVVRTDSVNHNNNSQACYKYDKADNRTNVTTSTTTPRPDCP